MKQLCVYIATLATLCSLLGTGVQAQELKEFSARYEASTNGMAGSARRFLTRLEDGRYRLTNRVRAELLGQDVAQMEQSSELALLDGGPQPFNYSYQISGISNTTKSISYFWSDNVAVSSEDDELTEIAIDTGVQDPLSLQLALRLAVIANPDQEHYSFSVIDGDEIEVQEYRKVGKEILDTPLGQIAALRLDRVRREGSNRSTSIWLAQDWDYLLARIEQVNASLKIELMLESATMADVSVTGL